ncbi:hypothetical protein [Photobacterium damselae]|uniref:hypothetical protein n=1 Tax=Photobacterium damselae TaxID=38293 RepID=UPI001F2F8BB1|nr:hypothetical protein [Photobacterium damselae]UKA04849.1 hypothetical protein IHC89_21640 [Photobacterium damselae subsp. damselae]
MKLTINGSEYDKDLIDHVKSALSETFSPVKKNGIVKAFLVRLVGANNEHELTSHFSSDTTHQPLANNQLTVLTLSESDCNETLGRWTRVCGSDAAILRCEKELFSEFLNHIPLSTMHKYVLDYFEDLIEGIILRADSNSGCDPTMTAKKMEEFAAQFRKFDADKIVDWLFENADSREIMEDFMADVSEGTFEIEYEYLQLHV